MSIEAEYFRQLIAKTRRDDAALLARDPLQVDDGDSLDLLRALAGLWPLDHFDEVNIAVTAPFHEPLKRALEPINPRFGQWGGRALTLRSQRQARRWLLDLVGREIGSLRLTCDPLGWFEFWGRRQ
jgi:hypothetical protein